MQQFMRRAIDLAIENARSGRGGPFGAVVIRDQQIIAEGVNEVTGSKDPTAHAEIVAIRNAARVLSSFDLSGCEIYASCEPCPMCLGACYWARVSAIHFGCTASDAANSGFDDSWIYWEISQPHPARKISMRQIMRDEALAAFRAWEASPYKTPY
jgi:tRNA(Arg) A34 adenosine deaminase TadA